MILTDATTPIPWLKNESQIPAPALKRNARIAIPIDDSPFSVSGVFPYSTTTAVPLAVTMSIPLSAPSTS